MNNKLKTLTLVTTGLVVGVVVGRVNKLIWKLKKRKYQLQSDVSELQDLINFKPKWKQVKKHTVTESPSFLFIDDKQIYNVLEDSVKHKHINDDATEVTLSFIASDYSKISDKQLSDKFGDVRSSEGYTFRT